MMTADYKDMLSAEERAQMDDLEERVRKSEDVQHLKKYTTRLVLLQEKARVRKGKNK
ncbi:hypothetical protein [Bacillus piscicola]|uniref:hypothetical protein n=1 Tax=Bacillus piscicola TaxID=1632684 RepID=UPI001F095185|nr:hypothetical protein [Bacillus piscicola]